MNIAYQTNPTNLNVIKHWSADPSCTTSFFEVPLWRGWLNNESFLNYSNYCHLNKCCRDGKYVLNSAIKQDGTMKGSPSIYGTAIEIHDRKSRQRIRVCFLINVNAKSTRVVESKCNVSLLNYNNNLVCWNNMGVII